MKDQLQVQFNESTMFNVPLVVFLLDFLFFFILAAEENWNGENEAFGDCETWILSWRRCRRCESSSVRLREPGQWVAHLMNARQLCVRRYTAEDQTVPGWPGRRPVHVGGVSRRIHDTLAWHISEFDFNCTHVQAVNLHTSVVLTQMR